MLLKLSYIKFISGYLIFLSVLCLFMFPSHDMIFYYYPWSLNLQLSYYDGPPMIAYIMRLMTLLTGHNIFAINFLGVFIAAITCYVIIKIGQLMHDQKLGLMCALMWLVYPFSTTRFIFVTLNYDCLDNLFSLVSILFVLRYVRYNKTANIYFTGIAIGLLLLSKYTGVVLILGIFFYLAIYLRKIFVNIHFYLALLLSLLIFSPVLIWNYQHDWISFKYQLSSHSWNAAQYAVSRYGISGVIFYLCSDILGVMHIFLLTLLMVWFKSRRVIVVPVNRTCHFLWLIVTIYFVFWLYVSYIAHVAMNYLLPMDSILIILSCYYLYRYNYINTIKVLSGLFVIISMVMLIDRTFVKIPEAGDMLKFQQVQSQVMN